MKYMGSKITVAKYIVPIIQRLIDENFLNLYIEPFGGGMNIIDKINCSRRIGSDNNKYLIALMQHIQNGLPLYDDVSKELYSEARTSWHLQDDKFEDWELGNIGFMASFGLRFFDGGYANPVIQNGKIKNYYNESKRNIEKQVNDLKNIEFACCDYREYNPNNSMIYCDPPYANTKKYNSSKDFNTEEFWNVMRKWSKNNIVLISEYNAPDDFKCIWEKQVTIKLNRNNIKHAAEKLFRWKG